MITKIVRTLSFPIQYLFPFINSIPLHLQKNIRSKTSKRKKKRSFSIDPVSHRTRSSLFHASSGGGRGNNPIIVPRCHLPSSPLLVPITQPWQLPLSKGRGGTETEGEREEKRFPLIQENPYHRLPSSQGKFQKPRAERRWNGGGKMGWKLCVFIVVE